MHPVLGACRQPPPQVVDLIDRNYSYKTAATQIPHNARLAPKPHTSRKFLPKPEPESALHPVVRIQIKPRDCGAGTLIQLTKC